MGMGGYKTGGGGGGAREVSHLRKKGGGGGAEKVLAMLKGGHKKFWGSFYPVAWRFNHIVGGGTESFHSLKGGRGERE